MTQPRFETLNEKKLVGKRLTMTYATNKTFELWRSFMPRRKEITNSMSSDLFSLQVYPESFSFTLFNVHALFEKWAAVEVAEFDNVPAEMEAFTLPGGLYAVFHYKGLNTDTAIFEYIYTNWLPASDYDLDARPHFEILGEKYKNGDPESEEDIWVPVKHKS